MLARLRSGTTFVLLGIFATLRHAAAQLASCSVGVYTIAGAPASALYPVTRFSTSGYFALAADLSATRTRRIYWNEYASAAPAGSAIRYLDESGTVGVFSGSTTAQGSFDGALLSATWSQVNALVVDPTNGNLFAADQNANKIRKITSSATSVAAGTGTAGCTLDGSAATTATVSNVMALVRNPDTGNIHFLNGASGCMRGRILTSANTVTSWVGTGSTGVTAGDKGLATAATFNYPNGLAMFQDSAGVKHWYIAASFGIHIMLRSRAHKLCSIDAAWVAVGHSVTACHYTP